MDENKFDGGYVDLVDNNCFSKVNGHGFFVTKEQMDKFMRGSSSEINTLVSENELEKIKIKITEEIEKCIKGKI